MRFVKFMFPRAVRSSLAYLRTVLLLLAVTATITANAQIRGYAQTNADSHDVVRESQQDGILSPAAVHNTWTTGAPMPTALQGPATGVIKGKVYVVGGATSSAEISINQIYNPKTNEWTTGASMPTARVVPAGAVVNNILYVIGGKLNGNQLNVVEAYDPTTDTWSRLTPMPSERDSIKAVVKSGIIYVIGGFNNGGGRLNTVESYNPATDTWTTEASLLVAKSSMAAGLLGSTIVAAAGLTDSGATGDNEGYKLSTNSWKTLTSDPTARWDGCSASILGQLYYAGGRNNSGPVSTVEYLKENTWTALTSIPVAPSNPGEAEVSNLVYCIGGSSTGTLGQGTLYNNVQIYHP